MQDNPQGKLITQLIAKPCEVSSICKARRCVCFHLNADDLLIIEFCEDVNLAAPVGVAQVEEAWATLGMFGLRTQLAGHEGVENAAQDIAISENCVGINPQNRALQSRVDEIPFGGCDQTLESAGAPCRELVGDEHL